MVHIPAYLPLALRWKPVGEAKSRPLSSAYVVLVIYDSETAELIRHKVGEGSILPRREKEGSAQMRLLVRTDARGVVMASPPGTALAPEARNLANLSPLLIPVGTKASLWWTTSEDILDAVLKDTSIDMPAEGRLELAFDDALELPEAIEQTLVGLDDEAEIRGLLRKSYENEFPKELLRLADDGRTWCVELHDHALELAINSALLIVQDAKLPDEHRLSAHQLLLAHVLDILGKRGKKPNRVLGSEVLAVIPQHDRLCGGEYMALASRMDSVLAGCRREMEKAGAVLAQCLEAALLELCLHGYPNGSFERAASPGMVSRQWASKLLLNARSLSLRNDLIPALNGASSDRLLKVASGEEDPDAASGTEVFLAQNKAVIAWLSGKSRYIDKAIELADLGRLDNALELTNWIEEVLVDAARRQSTGSARLGSAIEAGVRMAQTWAGLPASFQLKRSNEQIALIEDLRDYVVRIDFHEIDRVGAHFERAFHLLKVINGVGLLNAALQPSGSQPSKLDVMVNTHGFLEGVEGTYRILSKVAETEFGLALKAAAKIAGPTAVFVSAQSAWAHFEAGNGLATLLATTGVALDMIVLSLRAPHPAVKLALLVASLSVTVAASYAYDDDEEFLEKYRPGCNEGGAYLEAINAVRTLERELERAEGDNQRAARRVRQLVN